MSFDQDKWWRKQFARLLRLETQGRDPRSLEDRWLLLASRTWGDKRWTVSFEVPIPIYHVLDDADVRSKDRRYAEHQWQVASEWLNG